MTERIPITSREQWLALRRQDLTASDIAAVAGLSPYKSPLRVYAEKKGMVAEPPETPAMRRGRWLEDAVIAAIKEEYEGWHIEKPGVYVRDAEARIGATPDAVAQIFSANGFADLAVIQCKVVAAPIFEAGWDGGVPVNHQLQVLTEAMLWNSPRAYVAALVIGAFSADLHLFQVDRHPAAEKKIRDTVKQFWLDIEVGRPPSVDYSRDSGLLQELYRPRDGIEPIDLSTDNFLPELLEEREKVDSLVKAGKKRLDEIKGELIEKLNGSPIGICGEWKIANKITHRKSYTVAAADIPRLTVTKLKDAQ